MVPADGRWWAGVPLALLRSFVCAARRAPEARASAASRCGGRGPTGWDRSRRPGLADDLPLIGAKLPGIPIPAVRIYAFLLRPSRFFPGSATGLRAALGLELGDTQRLRDFDLSDPVVRAKLRERYGERVPLGETVIAPSAVFAAPELRVVEQR